MDVPTAVGQAVNSAAQTGQTAEWQITAAWIAAAASLIVVLVKFLLDGKERKARQAFEKAERKERQDFQAKQERDKLADQEKTLAFIELKKAELSVQIDEFLHRQQWRIQRRERMLARIGEANVSLEETAGGLHSLVDRGPVYTDLEMVTETAKVLEPFSKFKKIMDHYSITGEFETQYIALSKHITTLLLTLSPDQEIRKSDKRRLQLAPLKEQLKELVLKFAALCRDFEHFPERYDYGATETEIENFSPPVPARL